MRNRQFLIGSGNAGHDWSEKELLTMEGTPFSLVLDKLAEADFFLDKMMASETGVNLFEFRCYFSAFVSAARSISFSLQAVMNDIEGFQEWYVPKQEALRKNPLARFFVERRNEVQKVGDTRINSGKFYRDENGQVIVKYYFSKSGPKDEFEPIEFDIVTASQEYLGLLGDLVSDCYERFTAEIEPDLFFTPENLKAKNLSIEDVEEMLGFPRGWTEGLPDADRLQLLQESTPPIMAEWIVREHLPGLDK